LVLAGLSEHKLEETYFELGETVYRPNFKNIKTDEDLAREEFRGAILRYLLGMDYDALIHACFALEAGLLVKDKEKLDRGELEKKDIRSPFTLGRNMGLWLPKSKENKYGKGFVRNKSVIKQLERVKLTRDCHIHGFNFIGFLIKWLKNELAQYKLGLSVLSSVKANIEKANDQKILEAIDKIRDLIPSDLLKTIEPFLNPKAIRMIISDATTATKTIENLSDFSWCAEEEAMKLVEKRLEKYGWDFFHLVAKETLYDTYSVLTYIGIL